MNGSRQGQKEGRRLLLPLPLRLRIVCNAIWMNLRRSLSLPKPSDEKALIENECFTRPLSVSRAIGVYFPEQEGILLWR